MKRGIVVVACVLALGACDKSCSGGAANAGSGGTQVVGTGGGGGTGGTPGEGVTNEGERVVFADVHRNGPAPSHTGERALQQQQEHLVRTPTSPDPEHGEFTLDEAVAGMPIDGQLVAEIGTDLGVLECDLYADKAPLAVANFIGLARGLRPWWDARAGTWQTQRPYYRDTKIQRVIPGFLVQMGDYLEDGTGTVGYELPDEQTGLTHDRAGLLCAASVNGANHAGAQFYITDGAAPQLDAAGGTIFGRCVQTDVVSRLARLAQVGAPTNAPLTPTYITRVRVRRISGGAAVAQVTRPTDPDPYEEHHAGPGPSELHGIMHPEQHPQPAPPAPPH